MTGHPPGTRLILASGSPRRRQLLSQLGLRFEVWPSDVDESIPAVTHPADAVQLLAERKARAVSGWLGPNLDALVIAADTVVVLNGELLGKPDSPAQAVDMLTRLQGRNHAVYTGLCVLHPSSGRMQSGYSAAEVTMRSLTRERIERYVATGEPLDKAGSYAIQGYGATLVTGIRGDYFTVVGLPLYLLADYLAAFGVDVLRPAD
ncbi:MAG: septum formation inhibitor Maf [Alicyclobacillaceae bacterium]|nr:septum formation inhibitor Maf [Alicyclobacillaceae bacterium]